MKPKSTSLEVEDLYYDRAVRPIIKEMKATRGLGGELARQFGLLVKKHIFPQQTHPWLHPDPMKRIAPKHGTFLVLLKALDNARAELRKRNANGK